MASFLEGRGLTRSFGAVRAVRGVSFALEEGELLSIFGPNGAGKTTLLGLLSGALRPDQGHILLRGEPRDSGAVEWRRELGVLSHRTSLYGPLTGRENLAFFARLYQLEGMASRIEERLEEVGLTPHADRYVREYSRGMRQRLALARTLLHDPSLILLDEPFTGLDVHASALLREVLGRLKDGRRTVVLVTHNLAEGVALADRVAIQARGLFTFQGRSSDLPRNELERFYRERVDEGEGG